MQKTICAACGEGGGTFILRGDKWYHKNRCVDPTDLRMKLSTFPFSTMHLSDDPNSGPVTVESMRHLRRLEAQHGVVSDVYNNDSSYQNERY